MHILLPTDVFPPGSVGGAAWSSHTLARALLGRGHRVTAIVPVQGAAGLTRSESLGVPTLRWGYRAPSIPFVQNYFRHERLWHPLARVIADCRLQIADCSEQTPLLIHAQHVQTTPAAVLAGQRLRVPVVATVRDHWPWDYFATGLHGDRLPYPRNSWASFATDLPARLGPLRGTLALPALPYMLAHVRRRAAYLARADAVVAPSHYMARRLARIVSAGRIHIIPNVVDMAETARITATAPGSALDGPFMLFAGKLERNKGAGLLREIFRAFANEWPRERMDSLPRLLVAGSGALQAELERELAALKIPARFLAWVEHDEVLRLMARCELLLFPSAWGEPLTRTLLEAAAIGAPILAMPTGGTPDIISDGVNGALAATPAQFARRMAELLANPAERRRLAENARRDAERRYAVEAVVPQVEALYEHLLMR
jgi:glycosyltransferase involved in cell wall biosynthesis